MEKIAQVCQIKKKKKNNFQRCSMDLVSSNKQPRIQKDGRGPNSRGYGWTCSLHLRIHVQVSYSVYTHNTGSTYGPLRDIMRLQRCILPLVRPYDWTHRPTYGSTYRALRQITGLEEAFCLYFVPTIRPTNLKASGRMWPFRGQRRVGGGFWWRAFSSTSFVPFFLWFVFCRWRGWRKVSQTLEEPFV